MVKFIAQDNNQLYQCEACGFHYEKEELAKQCEGWCTAHNSCNVEITKHALENQKQK
ncbi:hypothetical protein HY477_02010 [Candidatus Uhrbacteria bacterium]|nr:hypothetical protein [Candidatus Uhrbacteria bacterium]